MSWWRHWLDRLAGRADADLTREIRAHLEAEADEQRAAGLSADRAHDVARRAFGSVALAMEDTRATWRFASLLERAWQDVSYAVRLMRKSPGFTAVVVVSLALGIGANTAIFSVMDAVVLKSLPVMHPEQLYLLQPAGAKGDGAFSYPGFEVVRRENQVFSETFNFSEGEQWNVIALGQAELMSGALVTGNYFTGLGVGPLAGRVLDPADDRESASLAAVISYRCWQRRFGLDVAAIGSAITVNGAPATIVGIAPTEFSGLAVGYPIDVWLPMAAQPRVAPRVALLASSDTWWLLGMGRLKPGISEAQARAGMAVVTPMVRRAMRISEQSAQDRFARIDLLSGASGLSPLRDELTQPLRILMIIAGLVLLIACANVANLLLSRANARRREMAIRLAIGGGRARLVQQLLIESLLLATMAGLAGLVLAWWSERALVGLLAGQRAGFALTVALDGRVFAFATVVSVLTGVLFGLAPALRATRLDPGGALREHPRSASGGRQSLSKALIVFQVALSLLLLAGAGLFLRTLQNLRHIHLGFTPDHVLLMTLEPGAAGYTDARLMTLYQQVLDRLTATPGVRSASLLRFGLLNSGYSGRNVFIPGYAPVANGDRSVAFSLIAPRFFETMGMPLAGREFGPGETASSPRVAIVNEKFARFYFGTDAVIGKRLSFRQQAPDDYEIVGVVPDAKYFRLRTESPRTVYVPFTQSQEPGRVASTLERMTAVIRTAASPASMAGAVQRAVQAVASDVPIRNVITQEQQIDVALSRERLLATLSTLFGGLALLLACLGLYGVMSYAVVRRTTEIGIRMALGARRRTVIGMVLRECAWLVLAGIAIGVAAATAMARLVESQLFALRPTDPLTLASAAIVLATAAALAGFIPARRASRVDPLIALRYE
jgi:predicted permease